MKQVIGILVTKPQLQKKPSTTDFRNMRLRKEDADKRGSKTGS
jgi:hypothetical protein